MVEAIRGTDYVLAAAVARAAMELPGPEVTAALADCQSCLPTSNCSWSTRWATGATHQPVLPCSA